MKIASNSWSTATLSHLIFAGMFFYYYWYFLKCFISFAGHMTFNFKCFLDVQLSYVAGESHLHQADPFGPQAGAAC